MAVGTQLGQQAAGSAQLVVLGIGGKPTDLLIANRALSHIGSTKQIGSLITEKSNEAQTCALHYVNTIDGTCEDFPWPELTDYSLLSLVETSPNLDWGYAYRYPNTIVMPRRIVTSLGRRDTNPPPFRVGSDATGKLIYAHVTPCTMECTKRLTDITQMSALFTEAASWKLAAFIAPGLSRVPKIVETCEAKYLQVLARAELKAAREQQQTPELESEMIRSRS